MVLTNSLFTTTPALDDLNRTIVSPGPTFIVTPGKVGGDIFKLTDGLTDLPYTDTYTSPSSGYDFNPAETFYTLITYEKVIQAKSLWIYWGAKNIDAGTNYSSKNYTATLQLSIDGSTWTDLDSVNAGGGVTGNEVLKSYSEFDKKFKYIRIKSVVSATASSGYMSFIAEIFELKVVE